MNTEVAAEFRRRFDAAHGKGSPLVLSWEFAAAVRTALEHPPEQPGETSAVQPPLDAWEKARETMFDASEKRRRDAEAAADEPATPEFIEQMRKGHAKGLPADEPSAWLVEWAGAPDGARWASVTEDDVPRVIFEKDVNRAMRFCRRQDASAFLSAWWESSRHEGNDRGEFLATEHVWCAKQPVTKEADQ